ncbi:TdeIII family type II restriction endonuclease [Shewanella phaeophyticola]|uniref:type II site-specific deoxyribonuclease n=1 Tax=Shewanella phaeophyticola TaxID=2978345 RepID=A0ABT2P1Y6_9GAMM|nr:TdeIII family type II restriction endonuclease [Shewanella sp. KJ10-1]MCT8985286.1 TdeIII family type II restriction endonuclease [Shewanella sp. KJ10-1]
MIFPKERRIRSLIGGLETSLGTRVWEPLAKAFANNNGFSVKDEKIFNSKVPVIPEMLRHFIDNLRAAKQANPLITHQEQLEEMREFIIANNIKPTEYKKIPKGEGIDIWLEKAGVEYIYDIKTTQINAGSESKFSSNFMNWYAYRLLVNNALKIECRLAFPFNPHKGKNFWAKEGGKSIPLLPSIEAVVGNEFWDFLLGQEKTIELIFECFKELGEENFGAKFDSVFTPKLG